MENIKNLEAIKKYVLGIGETEILAGLESNTKTNFICFGDLIKDDCKVGDCLLQIKEETSQNKTVIFIKNLEGLKVLEKAIKIVKKNIKEQNKKIK